MKSSASPIVISSLPERLSVTIGYKKIDIPSSLQDKIQERWLCAKKENQTLRNGEVYTVTSVDTSSDQTVITLAETDYAHYMYSMQVGGLGEYTVRIIHPAALVVSADDKLILGSMADWTSRPGIIQCCGGGIDHSDIEDGVVDIEHCIVRELHEELNIDVHDALQVKEFKPMYLKSGGPTGKMTVIYVVHINQTSKQFIETYDLFAANLASSGENAEFKQLFCISNEKPAIDAFVERYNDRLNEYVAQLLYRAQADHTATRRA